MLMSVNVAYNDVNPFVEISRNGRILLLAYFTVYLFLHPLITYGFFDTDPLVIERALAEITRNALLFLPVFLYRHKVFGWFHPLIFPMLFSQLMKIFQSPEYLAAPFRLGDYTPLYNPALVNFTRLEVAQTFLNADLLIILSLLAYYTGYFLFKNVNGFQFGFRDKSPPLTRIIILALIGLIFAFIVVEKSGGVIEQLLALGQGRFRYRMEMGGSHWIVLAGFFRLSLYIWFALRKNVIRNPLFILAVLLSLGISFLLTGSRAGVFSQIVILLSIWILKHQRVPVLAIGSAALIAFVSFGVLGQLRESGRPGQKEVDISIVTETSLAEKLSMTEESADDRPDGYVAVVGRSMKEVGPLYGRTYIAGLLFFVPRAIWPDKPRGAGAYNGNLIFGSATLASAGSGGEGGGVPTGPVGEAYWNFHIPGVIIVFLLYGLFHRWLAETHRLNAGNRAWLLIYIIALMNVTPVTRTVVSFMQSFVLIIVSYIFLHVIRLPGLAIR